MDSPFDVLHIESDADEADIDRAYRQRAKETHPDLGGSTEAFKRVNAAYTALKSGEWSANGDVADVGEDAGTRPRPGSTRVEYLNYEVLADKGWSLGDADLFENAAAADLGPTDYGEFVVQPGDSLLEGAEDSGRAWPFACRGGACANCAVAILQGELTQPVNTILPPEMTDRGIRLSCNGIPMTDELRVVYNLKYLPELDELRLPPYPFEAAQRNR
jgi:curved DNA-binding protein CbpA